MGQIDPEKDAPLCRAMASLRVSRRQTLSCSSILLRLNEPGVWLGG